MKSNEVKWGIMSSLIPEYMDDVCPYATFQLPDNPPPRPLLTTSKATMEFHSGNTLHNVGNVYSGPYHALQSPNYIYSGSQEQSQATLPIRVRNQMIVVSCGPW